MVMFNTAIVINKVLKDEGEQYIGYITDCYTEGHTVWAIVDEGWEVNITNCEYIIDWINGGEFIRLK